MTNDKDVSVESVARGLHKLIREVGQLKSEVEKLHRSLKGFKADHALPTSTVPYDFPWAWRTRPETDEPKSKIQLNDYEYRDRANLEIPTKTILAIAKELDGALRDIRAARLDIDAIAGDADLRQSFRDWQAKK